MQERHLPPDKKRLRLTDAGGLYLEVSPTGSKRWFWKTYADGKEGRLALGSYPEVTLKAVRLARDAAKRDRAAGIDLVQVRKLANSSGWWQRAKPSRLRRWSGTAGTKRAGAATTPFARSATSKKTCSPTSPSDASGGLGEAARFNNARERLHGIDAVDGSSGNEGLFGICKQ